MVDLTKITTPFGLLDEQTQFSLRMHGGPIEYYSSIGLWMTCQSRPGWSDHTTYRAKAPPRKPREFYIHVYENDVRMECIKVVEAIE